MTPRAPWLVLLALSLLPLCAAAQPPEESERDRARTFLVAHIAGALQLSDQDARKVGAVIRRSDERRLALITQRDNLEHTLRSVLAKTPADPMELTKLISAGNELDQQLALVPAETFRELQTVLNAEQQAKLMLFRRELQGEVRNAMQRRFGSSGTGRRGLAGGAAKGKTPSHD